MNCERCNTEIVEGQTHCAFCGLSAPGVWPPTVEDDYIVEEKPDRLYSGSLWKDLCLGFLFPSAAGVLLFADRSLRHGTPDALAAIAALILLLGVIGWPWVIFQYLRRNPYFAAAMGAGYLTGVGLALCVVVHAV